MNLTHPWQSYRRVALETAPPGQLVLMLFDGIIRFLEQARQGFAHEDPLEFNRTIHNNITRAQAILQELNTSLNLEAGGEFAATMRGLYNYMDRRLQESNVNKTPEGIREVISRVTVLRDAWHEMLRNATPAAAPTA
jgi:flagellar protein FliS